MITITNEIPNNYWVGKNNICLGATNGKDHFVAISVQEPNQGESYHSEILLILFNHEMVGFINRDSFQNQWVYENFAAFERDFTIEFVNKTIQPYLAKEYEVKIK